MADRPIIFSPPMVHALLDGRKSQTRRVLKPPYGTLELGRNGWKPIYTKAFKGDRLWVREAHALVPSSAYRMSDGVAQAIDPADADRACVYREGWERCAPRWRPSIHMPRWASRLTLIVTDVRVHRLYDTSEEDAVAEGARSSGENWQEGPPRITARANFKNIWAGIHGPEAWAANPWVAALSFETRRCNIDQMGDNHE